MKRIFTILLVLGVCGGAICKGSRGIYYLKGIAYLNKSMSIRNKEIELQYGEFKEKVKTNNKGEFSVKICWEVPCMSGGFREITKQDEQRIIASANPKYLVFQFKNKCIYIENYFYKYINSDFSPSSNPWIFNQNLKF